MKSGGQLAAHSKSEGCRESGGQHVAPSYIGASTRSRQKEDILSYQRRGCGVVRACAPDREDTKMGPRFVVKLAALRRPHPKTSDPRTGKWIAKALEWRDAAYRWSVRGLLWRHIDPTTAPKPRKSPPNHTSLGRPCAECLHRGSGQTMAERAGQQIPVYINASPNCLEPPRGRFMKGPSP